ncbi:hypothetical protein ACFRJ9_14635 [Paenarthrobacter sp. NPDC056912]|uniref:hypothetical protein n=1 Tax=Paenarthrobacter sp. NPDC056912 TaxID=3345965 RepID=UPI00366DDA2C
MAVLLLVAGCSSPGSGSGTNEFAQPQAGNGSGPSVPTNPALASCALAAAEVQTALEPWLGPGEVAIDLGDTRTGNNQCSYTLPKGSLTLSGDGRKVLNGSFEPSFVIHRYRYDDDSGVVHSMGIYNVDRDFGGRTPKAVFDSVSIAVRDVEKAAGTDKGVQFLWSEDGGLVTDGRSDVYVAGPGDYWYTAGIGGMKPDYSYASSLIELGKMLFTKGGSGTSNIPTTSVPPTAGTVDTSAQGAAPALDAALPALPVDGLRAKMAGTWTGAVTGDSSKYTVKATIRESSGVLTADVEYPELKCSATWTEVLVSGSAVSVKEKLKSGKCLDNVTIGLTLNEQTISAYFVGSPGKTIQAELSRG